MFLITTRLRRRPAIKKQSQISCEGATTETGVFELSGAFDIELNGQVVATNLEPQALVDYLNGTGDLIVDVIPETPTLLSFRVAAPDYSRYLEITQYTLDDGTTMEVDWGDGSPVQTFVKGGAKPYHEYDTGTECICTFKFNQSVPMLWFWGDAVTEVISFGTTPITNPRFSFETLTKVPAVLPKYVTNCEDLLYCCYKFNDPVVSNWDVSHVTKMGEMFGECYEFNQPLNSWNMSAVTETWYMLGGCYEFNQPLDQWDVSNVTNMANMFNNAFVFNQPLNMWNVSNVTNFAQMFYGTKSFNQSLTSWDTSSATTMAGMFRLSEVFNQPLNSWNVSLVTDMTDMFGSTKAFNQPLDQWNVGNVTNMNYMFHQASVFNQDLSMWCVSKIPSEPTYFSQDATSYTLPKPVWGTCPSGV